MRDVVSGSRLADNQVLQRVSFITLGSPVTPGRREAGQVFGQPKSRSTPICGKVRDMEIVPDSEEERR